jgi:hypothetical protein
MRKTKLLSCLLILFFGCSDSDLTIDDRSQALTATIELDAAVELIDCFDESCLDELYEGVEPEGSLVLESSPTEPAASTDVAITATKVPLDTDECEAQPEPACPAAPPGYLPQNPLIASGSLCRGACGANCPATCVAGPAATTCVEWRTRDCQWHAKTCSYPTQSCGSHLGCRVHDACYDTCVKGLKGAACRRQCDIGCLRTHGLKKCKAWMRGNGPYDSWLDYAGTPTSTVADTTCY